MAVRDERAKSSEAAYERKKRRLVFAGAALIGGLAFAGSLDRGSVGNERFLAGVLVLGAWLAVVLALHQLGRAGAD